MMNRSEGARRIAAVLLARKDASSEVSVAQVSANEQMRVQEDPHSAPTRLEDVHTAHETTGKASVGTKGPSTTTHPSQPWKGADVDAKVVQPRLDTPNSRSGGRVSIGVRHQEIDLSDGTEPGVIADEKTSIATRMRLRI